MPEEEEDEELEIVGGPEGAPGTPLAAAEAAAVPLSVVVVLVLEQPRLRSLPWCMGWHHLLVSGHQDAAQGRQGR